MRFDGEVLADPSAGARGQLTEVYLAILVRVHLLDLVGALVQHAVDGGGHGKGAADDGAEADEEAGEGLGALFAVDDFHGGDVLFVASVPVAFLIKVNLASLT